MKPAMKKQTKEMIDRRDDAAGIFVYDRRVKPSREVLDAVRQKYPTCRESRQFLYAQMLTAYKRQNPVGLSFEELELCFPRFHIANILGMAAA